MPKFRYAAIAAVAIPVAALAADMPTPGMWSVEGKTVDIEFGDGLPEAMANMVKQQIMSRPAQSHNQCVTQDDMENAPEKLVQSDESQCEYETFEISGGKMNAVAVCNFPQGGSGRMETTGTYTPTSWNTKSTITMNAGPMGQMTIKAEGTGTRTGDC